LFAIVERSVEEFMRVAEEEEEGDEDLPDKRDSRKCLEYHRLV
jgi:hypothetical protein